MRIGVDIIRMHCIYVRNTQRIKFICVLLLPSLSSDIVVVFPLLCSLSGT